MRGEAVDKVADLAAESLREVDDGEDQLECSPGLFQRTHASHPADGAAGIVSAAADANHSVGRHRQLSDRDLVRWFDSTRTATDASRATDLSAYMSAFACALNMHGPGLLVARRRADLLALRDQW